MSSGRQSVVEGVGLAGCGLHRGSDGSRRINVIAIDLLSVQVENESSANVDLDVQSDNATKRIDSECVSEQPDIRCRCGSGVVGITSEGSRGCCLIPIGRNISLQESPGRGERRKKGSGVRIDVSFAVFGVGDSADLSISNASVDVDLQVGSTGPAIIECIVDIDTNLLGRQAEVDFMVNIVGEGGRLVENVVVLVVDDVQLLMSVVLVHFVEAPMGVS